MKSESCNEVLAVLSHMEEKYQNQVPERLISLLKQNMSKTYHFDIDMSIPLWEQSLSEESLSMLALIDLNYWCRDEIHKQELLKQYQENERKNSESKRLEYRKILHSLNRHEITNQPSGQPKEEMMQAFLKEETFLEKAY